MRSSAISSKRRRRGIVLLDVVLALAVLSLAAFVLMPRPRAGITDIELRAEATRVAAQFREGRAQAIRTRANADIVVDARQGLVGMAGAAGLVRLREEIELNWATSSLCPLVDGRRALRFLADGRSCGGVLTLSANGRAVELRVDWLTGRVETSRI